MVLLNFFEGSGGEGSDDNDLSGLNVDCQDDQGRDDPNDNLTVRSSHSK